jgi:hypothetical protein
MTQTSTSMDIEYNIIITIFHSVDIRQLIFRHKEAVVRKDAKQLSENYAIVMEELGYYMLLALTRPIRLSERMVKFFGVSATTNIKVVNLLNTYTTIHNLTIPFTGLFVVDDALAKAFDIEPGLTRSMCRTITQPHVTLLPINSAVRVMRRNSISISRLRP